ncbi:hypothetical protein [Klebsiella phage phiKp_21]|nr:hypothetical protein [Klebsiella phage phiKp_21]
MAKKINTFDEYLESFKKSSKLNRNILSELEIEQLKELYNKFNIEKVTYLGKSPIRYAYNFINYNVNSSTWISDIKRIIELGNKANKEKMILMYGSKHGNEKWNNYLKVQSESNTFEYKNKKFGMTKEEFKEYNSRRSVTLKNLIKRHGEEIGLEKWNEYCDRQRYTTSLDYFIETYGEIKGTEKYESYIEVVSKNIKYCFKNKIVSNLENEVRNEIEKYFSTESQYIIETDMKCYSSAFDIYIPSKELLIEVHGDYWHMNPKTHNPSYINPTTKMSAKQKWHLDKVKVGFANKNGYDVIVIWESDWKTDKDNIMENIIKYEKTRN